MFICQKTTTAGSQEGLLLWSLLTHAMLLKQNIRWTVRCFLDVRLQLFLLWRHEKGLRICVDVLEPEVILIMRARAAALLVMDDLVLVHNRAPAILVILVVLDHGPTLLPQEGEMTILLPQRETKGVPQNHQDAQKNVMWIRGGNFILLMIKKNVTWIRGGDPILLIIKLSTMRGRQHLMERGPCGTGDHPGHCLQHLLELDHAQDPQLRPLLAPACGN